MDKSTVLDTCIVSCGRLCNKVPVGCVCAFCMVGCPRVMGTVHVQFTHLYYCSACMVVHDLCAGGCLRCVRQAMELCCVCVCVHVVVLMSMRIVVPRVISLITCRYSVNKSILSSKGWGDGFGRVLLLWIAICSVTLTRYLT